MTLHALRRVAAALALFLPLGVLAAPAPRGPGLELGLRVGLEVPTGTGVRSTRIDLSRVVAEAVPVWVEAGWRFGESLSASVSWQWGFGFVDGCDAGATCEVRDDRITAHLTWRFDTEGTAYPWLSAGVGYEWLRLQERGRFQADLTVHGLIAADLQAGFDFVPADGWVVGPYLSFAIGTYAGVRGTVMGTDVSGTYPESNRSRHHWSQFGFRTLHTF